MNRTSTTARTENRGGKTSRTPRDHYQEVTDRIIAALEAGTPPWRRPWDPDKAGGPAMPRNAATGRRYRGINVLTLGMSVLAFSSGDPRWATYKQAEDRGWQVRKGERGTTGSFTSTGLTPDDECRRAAETGEDAVKRIPLLRASPVSMPANARAFRRRMSFRQPLRRAPGRAPEAEALIRATAVLTFASAAKGRSTIHGTDHVQVPPPQAYFEADQLAPDALHELGHCQGPCLPSQPRSDRPFGSKKYAFEELVALSGQSAPAHH